MKVLFVSSGNNKYGIVPFIKSQGESLKENGIELDYYTIKGQGIKGYLSNILPLRGVIKKGDYDIIHSHYSLTSFVASISKIGLKIPQIVSLMGSDVNSEKLEKINIKLFNYLFWNRIIVKSQDMKKKIGLNNVEIIPNGIDFSVFKPIDKLYCKEKIGFKVDKKQIIWISKPSRYAKNYKLAKDAFKLAKLNDVELKIVSEIKHEDIPIYMNAGEMLLLSSRWEGSPNVIKEAMACNLPIVTTNVGDVELTIKNTEGCFIVKQNSREMAEAIKKCIAFDNRTKGREKIKDLDINKVAHKIISIYKSILIDYSKK